MHKVEPKVFLVGEQRIVEEGMKAFLEHIGVPDWVSDAPSDAEKIVEVMGRLCYKSFVPGLNANVTKVREHNDEYLANILKVKHGSVIEHAQINFIFADVSRVVTHELVRHRVGVGISQESLRYVRLTDLGQWLPSAVKENEEAVTIFTEAFTYLEQLQLKLAQIFDLDNPNMPFKLKKVLTSAMRRVAPIGLATNIGWSANFRTARFVIELRTGPEAEEEMRVLFGQVAEQCVKRYKNAFGDFKMEMADGLPWWKPANSKV